MSDVIAITINLNVDGWLIPRRFEVGNDLASRCRFDETCKRIEQLRSSPDRASFLSALDELFFNEGFPRIVK